MKVERRYSKSELPFRETESLPASESDVEPVEADNPDGVADISGTKPDATDNYEKSASYADPSIVFIISGGAVKERKYFSRLMNHESERIRLVFISKEGQGLVPSQMQLEVEEALEEECFEDYDHNLIHYWDGDRIYLVTDVDEFEHSLEKLIKQADSRFSWIVSNPCFEIWLYYHFFDTPEALADGLALSEDKRSKWLKGRLHDMKADEGGVRAEDAIFEIETAIGNSDKNYREKENGLPEVYSTQMHILATRLLDSFRDEIGAIFSERSRKAEETLKAGRMK